MAAGCLFDLDGLLLDTEPLHGQAWAEAVARFGATASPQLLLRLRGRNKIDNATGLINELQLPVSVEQLLAIQQPLARAKVHLAQAMPGAVNLVNELQLAGIPMAIATFGGWPLHCDRCWIPRHITPSNINLTTAPPRGACPCWPERQEDLRYRAASEASV